MKLRPWAVGILVVLLAAVGLVGAQLWHSFVWFGARSKAVEARLALERLCLAQVRLLADSGRPATRYRELGEEVDRGNRYAYFVGPGSTLEERFSNSGPSTPDPVATGVQVDLPKFGSASIEYRVSSADVPAQLLGGLTLGGNGECPKCVWTLVAAGNIDLDHDLDVWSAATEARRTAKGEEIPACLPFHEHDDIPPGPLGRLFH